MMMVERNDSCKNDGLQEMTMRWVAIDDGLQEMMIVERNKK